MPKTQNSDCSHQTQENEPKKKVHNQSNNLPSPPPFPPFPNGPLQKGKKIYQIAYMMGECVGEKP
jgi:hypothetical protein